MKKLINSTDFQSTMAFIAVLAAAFAIALKWFNC